MSAPRTSVSQASMAPVSLEGRVALVTGASSGIGRAITLALAGEKASVISVGRNAEELRKTTAAAARLTPNATSCRIDLTSDSGLRRLIATVQSRFGQVDLLVHAAGAIHEAPMKDALIRDLDLQYACNVRAVYALTQAVLPGLKAARGQIVFINSSAGLAAKRAGVGQYAATKHALKAIADSLREEVNTEGVRVLTVYAGQTATPLQQRLHEQKGRVYRPELLMQPGDVAAIVLAALRLPRTAEVTDISIRPMVKT